MRSPLPALALATACCLALPGCRDAARAPAQSGAGDEQLELRAYSVPPGQEGPLQRTLAVLMAGDGEARVGRVVDLPSGQLLVLAPASVHEGIARLLEDVEVPAEPPEPANVVLTYWFVVGTPAETTEIPATLRELASPLGAVQAAQGRFRFELLERVTLRSVSGDSAKLETPQLLFLRHRASVSEKGVDLELSTRLRSGGTQVDTTIRTQPGRFVVLAETGYGGEASDAPPRQLFHVIRAEVEEDGA